MEKKKQKEQEHILYTGKPTTWNEIQIGEVFAWEGCWSVLVKLSHDESLFLASDWRYWTTNDEFNLVGETSFPRCYDCSGGEKFHAGYRQDNLYKLPKSVQRLWLEE